MATGVQELKLAARIQKWSVRIAECRSIGMSVKAWCKSQGIAATTYYHFEKCFITEASQQLSVPASVHAGMLMRGRPDVLADSDADIIEHGITIRHGESVITLPAGNSAEIIADLVKALNCHASAKCKTTSSLTHIHHDRSSRSE